MNILYIHQYFRTPNESGGIRSYLLAKEFVKAGHNVIILTSYNSIEERVVKDEVDGISIVGINVNYSQELSTIRRSIAFILFVLKAGRYVLKEKKIDLVLATSTPLTVGILAILKRLIHKTPYVFEVRDVWPEAVIAIGVIRNLFLAAVLKKLEYIIYKYSTIIVPLSLGMKESITERYPEFGEKIVVIPNIADIDKFGQSDSEEQNSKLFELIGFKPKKSLLYAGTFGRVNGLGYVIELATYMLDFDPSLIFILIGEGSEKNKLMSKAKDLGVLEKNVFFVKPIPKSELPRLYQEVTLGSSFVIPVKELWRNSANKYFDTLASSTPIVINHGGWQSDEILAENIGYVLPEYLKKTEVLRFAEYVNKSMLLQTQGKNAGLLAKKRYSLKIARERYLNVFNRVQLIALKS